MQEIEPILAVLRRLGEKHNGRTPSQVALNWLICKGAVPIPGAKNAEQARQNAGALGWRLADEDVRALDGVAKPGLRRLMHVVWQHG
jgi:aryl-alcohol dehydrogenase-like predicted oxidoreductase